MTTTQQRLTSTGCPLKKEDLKSFYGSLDNYYRIRTCSTDIRRISIKEVSATNMYIATAPPVKNGRVELLHYLKEQSFTFEYHRYGSITEVPPVE